MAGAAAGLLVLDYDWSLINENSDTFVVQLLSRACYESVFRDRTKGWTETMDDAMLALHGAGFGAEDVRCAARSVPFFEEMRGIVEEAAARGFKVLVLSDANDVFIEEGLRGMGLDGLFALDRAGRFVAADLRGDVITNRAEEEPGGRLRIRPYHENRDCSLCPRNLCKGAVLREAMDQLEAPTVVYVGDGGGDYCPAARCLRAQDHFLYRSGGGGPWGFERRVRRAAGDPTSREAAHPVRCTLHPWSDGAAALAAFCSIVQKGEDGENEENGEDGEDRESAAAAR